MVKSSRGGASSTEGGTFGSSNVRGRSVVFRFRRDDGSWSGHWGWLRRDRRLGREYERRVQTAGDRRPVGGVKGIGARHGLLGWGLEGLGRPLPACAALRRAVPAGFPVGLGVFAAYARLDAFV